MEDTDFNLQLNAYNLWTKTFQEYISQIGRAFSAEDVAKASDLADAAVDRFKAKFAQ